MKRVAFIDHSLHKKTRSSDFFINLLKSNFEVDVFWCDSWKTKKFDVLNKIDPADYDIFIFFQVMYPIKKIKEFQHKCILIPMFDGARNDGDLFWYKYRKLRFFCFSKTLHARLKKLNIDSLHVPYYPLVEPVAASDSCTTHDKLSAFFWHRSPEITFNFIKKLISGSGVKTLHCHGISGPDKKKSIIDEKDILRYGVTFSSWFISRKEYLKRIQPFNIYFAPRLFEGIGMSFLEAMALGKCVVAPNNPTMNEYIVNGVNGILYNPRFPKPINFDKVQDICRMAALTSREGLDRWNSRKKDIIDFLSGAGLSPQNKRTWLVLMRCLMTTIAIRPVRSMIKLFDRVWFNVINKG